MESHAWKNCELIVFGGQQFEQIYSAIMAGEFLLASATFKSLRVPSAQFHLGTAR